MSESKLLAAVHCLKLLVDASRDRFDTERQLSVELDALKEARIFSMWVPRTLGGQELDPLSFLTVVEALARLDGSLGWCAVISAGYAWLSGMLNESFAREFRRAGPCAVRCDPRHDANRGAMAGSPAAKMPQRR
jgi:alkylation response protein AidB-like acyl-CoA dehydrogenase